MNERKADELIEIFRRLQEKMRGGKNDNEMRENFTLLFIFPVATPSFWFRRRIAHNSKRRKEMQRFANSCLGAHYIYF